MRKRGRQSKILPKYELIEDFGPALRGLGGLQTSRIRAFPGSKFGAASRGRHLSQAEVDAIEEKMRADGKLGDVTKRSRPAKRYSETKPPWED